MRVFPLMTLALVLALPWTGAAQGLQLRVVSNPRAEFVSGGDVLVSVTPPSGVQASAVRLTLNGSDITSALRPDVTGRSIFALVKNLNDGSNAIVATAGKATSKLTVVNHSNAGPVISESACSAPGSCRKGATSPSVLITPTWRSPASSQT